MAKGQQRSNREKKKPKADKNKDKKKNAVATSPAQAASLTASLEKQYGAGLEISYEVNPALIGGLRIQVGSDLYDGSVKTRLEKLQQSF